VNAARQPSGAHRPLAFVGVRRKLDAEEDDVCCDSEVRDGSSGLHPINDGRGGRRKAGADWDTGQPMKQEAGETTGEQRISKDITADEEGKALKTRILWVDVARNKATRSGWEKAVERVRNPVDGWCS